MEELFENWSDVKSALLEGLTPQKQKIVAPVLENQKNHILKETAATGSTSAHDIAGFRKILIPMIRRIIPGTIATELVGVQPMQGPVGLVYTMRYKYQEAADAPEGAANPFGNEPNTGVIAPGDEAFGNDPVLRQFYSGSTGSEQLSGASGIGHDSPAGGDNMPADIDANSKGGAWESTKTAGDVDSDSPTVFEGGGYATDLNNEVWGNWGGGSGSFIEGSGGRKMALEVVSQAVEAGSRKLQAGWTVEAMQDLQSQHGLDLESEMTQALSAEIVQEIDAEIIADLLSLAGIFDTFDGSTTGTGSGPEYSPAYIGDRFANLGVIINRVANEIGSRTRRGIGNYIVVSPMIVSVLQSASKSVFAPAVDGSFKGPNNTMMVGTLNGTIKVYSYLWNQAQPYSATSPVSDGDDVILVGYKGGNGETDAGYFYCPYIPLMSSGVVANPVTFQPVVSLMTRYGKTAFVSDTTSLGNSADYYGKITVLQMTFA